MNNGIIKTISFIVMALYKKIYGNLLSVGLLLAIVLISCSNKSETSRETIKNLPMVTDKKIIEAEMNEVLNTMFEKWYPLVLDTIYGGFFSDLDYKWQVTGPQNKMIVTQSRHVWSVSNVIIHFPEYNDYRYAADFGYKFLRDVMWDKEYGGFYDTVNREGKVITQNGKIYKNAYGNSFAIYALSAYYKLTKDNSALELAKETFYWMDKHSYDPVYGGYFQFLQRDGEPLREGFGGTPPKDYNSSIHILECFTELYKVWPDKLLKQRLEALLGFVRDIMINEKGYLELYFSGDLKHISFHDSDKRTIENNYLLDHITFGHDVETAYLMLEASEVLELKNDTKTIAAAKKMVDHSLLYGIDKSVGGLYDGGYYFDNDDKPTIVKETKEWWAQVEAVNSFLLMAKLYPEDSSNYFDAFILQWDYCKKYLIDPEYGDWYWSGIDKVPGVNHYPKSSIWKCNYHTSRSLINCIETLRKSTIQ